MGDWRELKNAGKFAEAEPLMLDATPQSADVDPYGDNTVTRAEFYEAWGDHLKSGPDAEKQYWQSHNYWALFASWSTSGGEGTARMMDVNRVLRKIKAIEIEN